MKISKPTYEDSILQVANSVRKFLGLNLYHDTNNSIDTWMKTNELQQIVLFLVDGMGSWQITSQLAVDGFFRNHMHSSIQTVFPPTTVAATTTLRTGNTPAETGYLGWHQYQEEVKDTVTMFQSRGYYDETKRYPGFIAQKYPITLTIDEANKQGILACEIYPTWKGNQNHTIEDLCQSTLQAIDEGNRYIYSYWDEYDAFMHEHGVVNDSANAMLKNIEIAIAEMAKQLPKRCGLIVLADHGHIDVENLSLCDYPDLMECLSIKPTVEMRCVNFYVNENDKEIFNKRFHNHFKEKFILYTHEEVIAQRLFGNVCDDATWEQEIGDFVAIAIDSYMLSCGELDAPFIKGNHAGMTDFEMNIPLILYAK